MAYDGNGNFLPLPSPTYPAVPGAVIYAEYFNLNIDNIHAGLDAALPRNGEAAMTGPLRMSNNRVQQILSAVGNGDAVEWMQWRASFNAPNFNAPTTTDPTALDNSDRIPNTRWVNQVLSNAAVINFPPIGGLSDAVLGTDGVTVSWKQGYVKSTILTSAAETLLADATVFPIANSGGGWLRSITWVNLRGLVKAWLVTQANTWTGKQKFSGGVEVTGGMLGYGVGAGAAVAQITSKTTPVTIDALNGKIVTHFTTLSGGQAAAFAVSNNKVKSLDTVVGCIGLMVNSQNYSVRFSGIDTGALLITIKNESSGTLSESVPIHFAVFQGSQS